MFVETQFEIRVRSILVLLICVTAFIFVSCQNEPYEGEIPSSGLNCETAIANTAQAALSFLSANDDNYTQLCIAYRNALQAQILACGDPDGSLQTAINALGDCTVTVTMEDDCDSASDEVDAAELAFQNANVDNYTSLCITYRTALENQIMLCGDDDGSIQSIIDSLGDCINSASFSEEIYITGVFNGESIVIQTGTSDNYLPGVGSGFTSLNYEENNCIIGYKGTVASSLPFNELPLSSVSFDYFYDGECDNTNESSVFNSIFANGNYEAIEAEGGLLQGMHFEYYPIGFEGVWYTTAIGDQSGSQFEITNSESVNYTLNSGFVVHRQIVEGTFNCTLYDTSSNLIEVTNGTFRVLVRQFF